MSFLLYNGKNSPNGIVTPVIAQMYTRGLIFSVFLPYDSRPLRTSPIQVIHVKGRPNDANR